MRRRGKPVFQGLEDEHDAASKPWKRLADHPDSRSFVPYIHPRARDPNVPRHVRNISHKEGQILEVGMNVTKWAMTMFLGVARSRRASGAMGYGAAARAGRAARSKSSADAR